MGISCEQNHGIDKNELPSNQEKHLKYKLQKQYEQRKVVKVQSLIRRYLAKRKKKKLIISK